MYVYLEMYAFSSYIIRLDYKCHENFAYVAQLMLENIERIFCALYCQSLELSMFAFCVW